MKSLLQKIFPPPRYWVVYHNGHGKFVVVLAKRIPKNDLDYTTSGVIVMDGPFEYQEDAANRLAFWRRQHTEHPQSLRDIR